jgi:hypothetical protein
MRSLSLTAKESGIVSADGASPRRPTAATGARGTSIAYLKVQFASDRGIGGAAQAAHLPFIFQSSVKSWGSGMGEGGPEAGAPWDRPEMRLAAAEARLVTWRSPSSGRTGREKENSSMRERGLAIPSMIAFVCATLGGACALDDRRFSEHGCVSSRRRWFQFLACKESPRLLRRCRGKRED